MLGCTALEKTRCKKHGQAILFFHRNFSEGCAILVCDFHFPKNICKTVIVSISQKWVCDNRAVQKLPWSFYFHLPLWFSFLHMVFPFGINRYRAGAKVWQRALEIKGRAFSFRKISTPLGSIFRKTLYFQPRRPWKAPETKRPMRQEDAKKNVGKGSDQKVKKRELPFSSWNRK